MRDVVFGEDACRVRSENALHVFAALRNTALDLLRRARHTRIASATRLLAAQATRALGRLGLTTTPN